MERRLEAVVDVMRVPAAGDVAVAIVPLQDVRVVSEVSCDVLVVGGGTGGVAAALAAVRRGRLVHLLEETDWLGGQLTAQGVSALDEHAHIERFGGTASYYSLRDALRERYRPLAGDAARHPYFNPGNCWVSALAFEPQVAVNVIDDMLRPHRDDGRLRVHLRTKAFAVTTERDRIVALLAVDLETRAATRFTPALVIDATELGDVLPLAGAEYRVGAETAAETAEPHAQPEESKPHCVQSFTYTTGLERRARGESHVIGMPAGYAGFRARQPYSLTIQVHGGEIYGEESGWLAYKVFETLPGTKGSLWTYRRLIDREQFAKRHVYDLSMINWPGNDYRDAGIIDVSPHAMATALQDAKRVSLGFLHWLQTEAPAEADRTGAPELMLQPAVMGSADGLSKHPYVREARRIRALRTVVEQDVSTACSAGPRARHCEDSVGVGWYPIDIHRAGPEDVGVSCRTHPFQIPLGALVPARIENLLAAAKNIGTTHITNGCYRLHPVEWNIGEAAGALAAMALHHAAAPRVVHDTPALRARLQASLVAEGVPLAWAIDVGVRHPAFAAVQSLCMRGALAAEADLMFHPDAPLTEAAWRRWGGSGAPPARRADGALALLSL